MFLLLLKFYLLQSLNRVVWNKGYLLNENQEKINLNNVHRYKLNLSQDETFEYYKFILEENQKITKDLTWLYEHTSIGYFFELKLPVEIFELEIYLKENKIQYYLPYIEYGNSNYRFNGGIRGIFIFNNQESKLNKALTQIKKK